uniref:Uncharacterized protein n=1 Tax=Arundo donax TaxID=35708 RepID=A0A0A9AQ75_ARUDO
MNISIIKHLLKCEMLLWADDTSIRSSLQSMKLHRSTYLSDSP